MRKKILLLLSLILIFTCSSCKKEEVEVTSTPPPVETEEPEYVLKGDYLEEYKDIRVTEESKFLGTAIVKLRPEEYQYKDIPIISTEQENADLILTLMHLDSSYMDEFAISASDSYTRAYTFAIIKPKVGYEQTILVALDTRMTEMEERLKNYPDQLYIINNAVVQQVGDYIVFIACDNADDVYKELFNVMSETDLSVITPVPFMTEEERKELEDNYLKEQVEEIESNVTEIDFIEGLENSEEDEDLEENNVKNNSEFE